jgi:hypothetical protein
MEVFVRPHGKIKFEFLSPPIMEAARLRTYLMVLSEFSAAKANWRRWSQATIWRCAAAVEELYNR